MKLSAYIKQLQDLVKKNPEYADLLVAYATDDEGNSYQKIHNKPTPVEFEDVSQYHLEVIRDINDKDAKINGILIN